MMDRAERRDRLAVDVDTRLTDLWLLVMEDGSPLAMAAEAHDAVRDTLGSALRAAYACGYRDALQEDSEGRRGELARANGYTEGEA